MDKLEDHIKKNREDLDRYSPSSGVWKRIKRELKKKGSPKNLWFSIAASVIIILGTALVLFRPGNRLTDTNNEISKDNRLTPVNSQLKETEIY
jgi:hypothetical protein